MADHTPSHQVDASPCLYTLSQRIGKAQRSSTFTVEIPDGVAVDVTQFLAEDDTDDQEDNDQTGIDNQCDESRKNVVEEEDEGDGAVDRRDTDNAENGDEDVGRCKLTLDH